MSTINLRENIWARVRSECAAEVRACALAIKEHHDLIEEYTRRSLLPGQATALLQKLSDEPLQDCTPERAEAHALILSKLRAIKENVTVQTNAQRAVNVKFMEAEPAILAMEKAVAQSLDRQTAELVEAERAFFAGYGLTHEQTAVSRLAESLKEIAHVSSFAHGKSQITGLGGALGAYIPRLTLGTLEILLSDH